MKLKLKKIFGKRVDFYSFLQEQAFYITESVAALAAYAKTLDNSYAEKVKSLEKDGDRKRLELIQNLGATFITPFDREDIDSLSKSLDDVMDYYKTTVKEMEIYQIRRSPELNEFVKVLKIASDNLYDAVCRMEYAPKAAIDCAVAAKKCENKIESLYRHSVASLLTRNDIKYIIKMRELYRHLSNCADRIDEASDCVCRILMKEVP